MAIDEKPADTNTGKNETLKFLLEIKGEMIEAGSRVGGSPYSLGVPLEHLAHAAIVGQAIDLIAHGFPQEAVKPLEKIVNLFNAAAAQERKEAAQIFNRVLGNSNLIRSAETIEAKAAKLKEILKSL